MEVPLVDLSAQHRAVEAAVRAGFEEVLQATSFIKGPAVAAFEREYAQWLGVSHCVGVGNGTDALELALRAVGVVEGDEVIVPANTFIATAEAVVRAGARPVLADVDDAYLLLDAEAVRSAVGPRATAVMPVHLYGQVAPMEQIGRVAAAAGLRVVEDAAQAQGARRFGASAGSFGDAAGTSFYPGKNLGAYGDGGAVLTNDADVAARVRMIADHGSVVRYRHEVIGCNSRLDSLQAVVLSAKLAHLAAWNAERRAAAERYASMLDTVHDVRVPGTLEGNEHVWHLYVVRVPDRDGVLQRLHEQGIGAAIHYPVPVHLQPAFRHLGHVAGDFPVAEAAAGELLSIPLFPGITAAQQERVVEALEKALAG